MSFLIRIKKILLSELMLIIISVIIFGIINTIQYNRYKSIVNTAISGIVNEVKIKYPDVDEEEIINILKNTDKSEAEDVLKKYGYSDQFAYIKKVEDSMNSSIIIDSVIIGSIGILSVLIYCISIKKQENKLLEINKYISELNNKNYALKIEDNGEDELSKLRNQLYKTTILLKETAENSEKEKLQLENALADISHQLKTPLTSIRIMLDNIYENQDMDEKTKREFIKDISKQIEWITSLVISLLKLAKFDSGSIEMNDKEINVKNLIENIISNLSIMLEIKNIEIVLEADENITLYADYKWQQEALTNIIKNSIEHSKENSKIHIKVENSSLFLRIKIQDEGEGIDKEDIKHIFKRFYKAKNSDESSIGIGLSLAKTIIEKENGYIKVDSEKNKGTTFTIKYMK